MTRDSDVFIPLNDRVAMENKQKNAVFVSIHFNDSRKRKTRGFEAYYHSGASVDLANGIQQKLMTIPNSANGGIHTANFRVLRLANCPAVLVECGYLSNRNEGNQARDWEYRELLADQNCRSDRRAALRHRRLSANRAARVAVGTCEQQIGFPITELFCRGSRRFFHSIHASDAEKAASSRRTPTPKAFASPRFPPRWAGSAKCSHTTSDFRNYPSRL